MNLKPSIPIFLVTLSTVTGCSMGVPYLGSFVGNTIYLLSISFLITFTAVNIFYRQLIEEDLSKRESVLVCVGYLSAIPLIYLIYSLKPPSIFLMSLSVLYLFLTIIWTTFACERKNINLNIILLFVLCLLPLVYGIHLSSNYEKDINKDITYLEVQKEYYDAHLGDIACGIDMGVLPPQLDENHIGDCIGELGDGLEEVRKCYQTADYNKCHDKIEELKLRNAKIDDFFEWLNPEKKMCEELHHADKGLSYRYEQYCKLMMTLLNEDNANEEMISDLKEIGENISTVREKIDRAWCSYENGEYNNTHKTVIDVKAEYYGDLCIIDKKMVIVKYLMDGAIW